MSLYTLGGIRLVGLTGPGGFSFKPCAAVEAMLLCHKCNNQLGMPSKGVAIFLVPGRLFSEIVC